MESGNTDDRKASARNHVCSCEFDKILSARLAAITPEMRQKSPEDAARLESMLTQYQMWEQNTTAEFLEAKRRFLVWMRRVRAVAAVLLVCCYLVLTSSIHVGNFADLLAKFLVAALLILFGSVLLMRSLRDRLTLPKCSHRSQIGPLLDLLSVAPGTLRDQIEAALTHILPELDASSESELTTKQMSVLYGCVTLKSANRRPDFVVAVLKVVEIEGDSRAPMQEIASLKFGYPVFVRDTGVSDAAGRCLAVLEARLSRTQNAEKLLRSADQPADRHSTLLRPAQQATARDRAYLVQSVTSDERSSYSVEDSRNH